MRSLLLLEDQIGPVLPASWTVEQLPVSHIASSTATPSSELAVDFRDAPQLDRLLGAAGFVTLPGASLKAC